MNNMRFGTSPNTAYALRPFGAWPMAHFSSASEKRRIRWARCTAWQQDII